MVVGTGVTRKVLYVSTVTIYNRKMLGEQHRFVTKSGINLGRFGVELFFVLSGRLMAEILFVQKMPLDFFLRRFSRVYPALFVFVLAMGLTSLALHGI